METVSELSCNSGVLFYGCQFCSKVFPRKTSLNRHVRVCSRNDNANKTLAKCEVCGRPFNRIDNLKKHLKNCTARVTQNKQMKKRSCLYENCEANFYQKEALIQHLTNIHRHNFEETSRLNFQSYEDFISWKKQIEEETFAHFIKVNGKKGAVQYFYCQQDGERDKVQCRINYSNFKDQTKTGKTCIAYMKLIELEGTSFDVLFQPMHCHLLKPRETSQKYADEASGAEEKPAVAESVEVIEVTELLDDTLIDVENHEDLLLVERLPDNETTVINIVQNCLRECDSPVILYKSDNPEVYVGPEEFQDMSVMADTFILGIQTKEQREMFVNGCQVALSLDTSYRNEGRSYQILNLVVPDEKMNEYPVAHLITNSMSSSVLKIFFYSILFHCQDVTINCIISNNDPELNEAIQSVFSENVRHVFCIWKTYKDFLLNLSQFAPEELHYEMFQALQSVAHSDNEIVARNILENFKELYSELSPNFLEFLSNYENHLKKWMLCFRDFNNSGINTVMLSEAYHNKILKHMRRKSKWNLEDFINLLLELEEDDYLRRANEQILGVSFGLSDPGNSRHEEGVLIPDDAVTFLFQDHWEIKSSTNISKFHLVVRVNHECTAELCYKTCSHCHELCGHLYYCTCTDKHPMCKHIHKVHLFFIGSQKTTCELIGPLKPFDGTKAKPVIVGGFNLAKTKSSQDPCEIPRKVEITGLLRDLSSLLSDKDLSLASLKSTDERLRELVDLCKVSVLDYQRNL
ncbi:uncharacterized protein [Bemisia tabaci]|uniref:uncharacterized protein n=1 Tax=Bemisia tabaci TaxID=7038 RepID=UPI0008F9DCAC|nr:PREDICTED: uncharacterized protein LOC109037924 isoform X1 [Bemisia tabaci]